MLSLNPQLIAISVTVSFVVASGVYDVSVEKCIFEGTDRGLRIKTGRGKRYKTI
nr:hypothetical protein [uncultured Lachnoanaerobaculum sp.]